jgi:hypothetical protein
MLIFVACKKNSDKPPTENLPVYIGMWELRSSTGMLGQANYLSGQGNYLEITPDSVILTYHYDRVDASTYSVEKDTTYFFGEPRLMDQLVARDSWSFFFVAADNSLTTYFGTPAFDGGSSVYVRALRYD